MLIQIAIPLAILLFILFLRVPVSAVRPVGLILWLVAAGRLGYRGVQFLSQSTVGGEQSLLEPWHLGLLALAIVIGLAKGKMVLDKSAKRNVERLEELSSEPQAWVPVYALRTRIVIAAMMGIGILLTVLSLPDAFRGVVLVAVATGLLFSSRLYLQSSDPSGSTAPSANS